MLHYGGNFTSEHTKFGPSYRHNGGEVFVMGKIGIEGLTFQCLLKMIRQTFEKYGPRNLTVYTINDGIRSRVDDDADLSFQWQTLPADEDGFTHFYCVNGDYKGSSVMHEMLSSYIPSMDKQTPSITVSNPKARSNSSKFHGDPKVPLIKVPFPKDDPKVPKMNTITTLKKMPVKRKAKVVNDVYNESNLDLFVDFGDLCGFPTQESHGNMFTLLCFCSLQKWFNVLSNSLVFDKCDLCCLI